MKKTLPLASLALSMMVTAQAISAEPAVPVKPATPAVKPAVPNTTQPAVKPVAPATTTPAAVKSTEDAQAETGHHQFRASTIESMRVYNPNGDELGSVKDLVIDMGSGKVQYAALDFGGFLGIGDKLFAVPWHAFTIGNGKDHKDRHLVLDVTKDRLKSAPGFDKNHWPDTADPSWSAPVDQFYGRPTTAASTR